MMGRPVKKKPELGPPRDVAPIYRRMCDYVDASRIPNTDWAITPIRREGRPYVRAN